MKQGLKITVIGAGSTYTPELIEGIIKRRDELTVGYLYLMDIDRRKLDIIGALTKRMLDSNCIDCKLVLTEDLIEAIEGADFVLGQIRVGRLQARILDEKIPLKYGLIGQETTGIGGFMKAMRTIPVMLDIAKCIEKYSSDAWLINFSNPSGIIAETLLNNTNVKMIGICNSPTNMRKGAMRRVPEGINSVNMEFVGLNHLIWITKILCDGHDILKDQLIGNYDLTVMRNIPKVDFDDELIKCLQAIPSYYLTYYYYRDQQLKNLLNAEKSRGEECIAIEEELLELYSQPELKEKPAIMDKRGGHSYSEAAISLVSAIQNDKNEVHVVNVKNNGALDFMADDDVIEISCNVNKSGAAPIPVKNFSNDHIKGMMKTVKAFEKYTVRAGLSGDYHEALNALLMHPLIGDYEKAKGALDELLSAHRRYLPQFF